MFFSKIIFEYKNESVVSAYNSCQEMHSLIMKAFPKERNSESPRNKYGVIYRLVEKPSFLMAYVYSKVTPNWSSLMEAGVLMSAEVKNVNEFISEIRNNEVFKFQLSVFMSKRPKDQETGKSYSNAISLTSAESKRNWIERASQNNGFEVIGISEEIEVKKVFGIKHQPKNGFTLTTISGILKVCNSKDFIKAYTEGMGRGKAYGAGMMLLSK